ncbi:hypothetical protein G6F56_007335 [Rhizopus delemar]|uniref:EB1 C-terminal domain-containing protein n=1 Tax=Rhizopus stolonifer TaxID=4846 RepID=A0A367IM26_RHIST|nr:hypothetical protein G6F56_007335 [Rhizopus delemar]RCH78730.1 hypothetical protein CU098_006728 [Rhizopus stolonifer]
MQWVKKYWDQNYPGGEYDPLSRREKGAPSTVTKSSAAAPSVGRTSAASKRATKTPAARSVSRGGRPSVFDNQSASVIIDLNKQIAELKLTVDGLEKERDFYFGKLREIEIEVQESLETVEIALAESGRTEHEAIPVLQNIQNILYSTEEGFEVPPEEEEEANKALEYDDDETF